MDISYYRSFLRRLPQDHPSLTAQILHLSIEKTGSSKIHRFLVLKAMDTTWWLGDQTLFLVKIKIRHFYWKLRSDIVSTEKIYDVRNSCNWKNPILKKKQQFTQQGEDIHRLASGLQAASERATASPSHPIRS